MKATIGQPVTLAPAPSPADAGLACRKCGAAKFTTVLQTFRDGTKHVRLDCAACKTFVRYASQDGAPEPRHEHRPPDAHDELLAAPPASWHWLGLIRQDDGVWRAVALCPTLERCWEALLTLSGEGDRLCVPTRPPKPEK